MRAERVSKNTLFEGMTFKIPRPNSALYDFTCPPPAYSFIVFQSRRGKIRHRLCYSSSQSNALRSTAVVLVLSCSASIVKLETSSRLGIATRHCWRWSLQH